MKFVYHESITSFKISDLCTHSDTHLPNIVGLLVTSLENGVNADLTLSFLFKISSSVVGGLPLIWHHEQQLSCWRCCMSVNFVSSACSTASLYKFWWWELLIATIDDDDCRFVNIYLLREMESAVFIWFVYVRMCCLETYVRQSERVTDEVYAHGNLVMKKLWIVNRQFVVDLTSRISNLSCYCWYQALITEQAANDRAPPIYAVCDNLVASV